MWGKEWRGGPGRKRRPRRSATARDHPTLVNLFSSIKTITTKANKTTKTYKTKTYKKYNDNDDKTTKNVIIETIYEKYTNYIQEIIKNDKTLWDFKSNQLYNDILEHLPKHFSYNYFTEIKKNFYKFYINNKNFLIKLCNTNDMYGKPKQLEFHNFTKYLSSIFFLG